MNDCHPPNHPDIKASASFSSPGARPGQEDHALVFAEKRIFVVADGFGGPIPGAAAAKSACESIKRFLHREAGDEEATMPFELRSYYSLAGNVLFNALVHANRNVLKLNRGKGVHERGGASVLAGFMDGDLLALANVGACTAWLMRGGVEVQLATPRTYARLLDPFEVSSREDWQVPLAALGIAEDLEPEIFEVKVQPGDWIFIHTDGLLPLQRERVLKLQRGRAGNAEQAARAMLQALGEESYSDNATAALIVF